MAKKKSSKNVVVGDTVQILSMNIKGTVEALLENLVCVFDGSSLIWIRSEECRKI